MFVAAWLKKPGGNEPGIIAGRPIIARIVAKQIKAADMKKIRMVRISNTLHVKEIDIAESLLEEHNGILRLKLWANPEKWCLMQKETWRISVSGTNGRIVVYITTNEQHNKREVE